MIKTKLISVGKLKEKSTRDLISEYEKRLQKYTDFSHIEVADLSVSDNPNPKEIEAVLQKEGAQILKQLPKNMVTVAMAIDAKQYSSEEFAALIDQKALQGGLCFVIGSSHGLHPDVIKACQMKISLSKMTLPHNLARLMLTEQIYRGFKILNNENYHK
ncbi:MAG: 23S rRNA (pseudouridine(1915)-N(3))-methyltransferase RlmH [Clostridia bacterium]|nr:23S rRNA (pseudouridine(1915)-N(3))-methyltransferase RlmH [Clostridia bacterium]